MINHRTLTRNGYESSIKKNHGSITITVVIRIYHIIYIYLHINLYQPMLSWWFLSSSRMSSVESTSTTAQRVSPPGSSLDASCTESDRPGGRESSWKWLGNICIYILYYIILYYIILYYIILYYIISYYICIIITIVIIMYYYYHYYYYDYYIIYVL